MATQFEIDCALMAGRAYQTNRTIDNLFPIPSGWVEFFHVPNSNFSTSGDACGDVGKLCKLSV